MTFIVISQLHHSSEILRHTIQVAHIFVTLCLFKCFISCVLSWHVWYLFCTALNFFFYWVSSRKSEHFTADARAQRALGVLEGSGPVNMLSNPSTCVFLWNCGRKDGIVYLVQLESDVEDDSLIIEQACQEDDTSLRVRAGSERVWVLTIDLIWYWISF